MTIYKVWITVEEHDPDPAIYHDVYEDDLAEFDTREEAIDYVNSLRSVED